MDLTNKKTNVVCSAGKDTEYLLKLWFYGDLNLSAWIYNYVKHLTVLLVMIPRLKFDSIQFMTLTTLKIKIINHLCNDILEKHEIPYQLQMLRAMV
jgi:hypothetical protein